MVLKRPDAATSCIILKQPIKYNLQVLALKKHTTLSSLINAAAEEYLRREEEKGVVVQQQLPSIEPDQFSSVSTRPQDRKNRL